MNMLALMVMSIGQVLVPSDPIQVGGFRAVASSPTFTRYCATHNHYVIWQKQLGSDGSWLYRKISQTAPRPVVTYTAPVVYTYPVTTYTYATPTYYGGTWGTWTNYRTPAYTLPNRSYYGGGGFGVNTGVGFGGGGGYARAGGGTCRGGMCVR